MWGHRHLTSATLVRSSSLADLRVSISNNAYNYTLLDLSVNMKLPSHLLIFYAEVKQETWYASYTSIYKLVYKTNRQFSIGAHKLLVKIENNRFPRAYSGRYSHPLGPLISFRVHCYDPISYSIIRLTIYFCSFICLLRKKNRSGFARENFRFYWCFYTKLPSNVPIYSVVFKIGLAIF